MVKTLVLLAILAILAGIFWLLRGRGIHRLERLSHQHKLAKADDEFTGLTAKKAALTKLHNNQLFWGVEIQRYGCAAAAELKGKQFTFEEAPDLPLEKCDARICPCQYKGLKEHRSSHRRIKEDRRESLRFDIQEADRRTLKDRRRKFDQWKGRA
jgi:hypothetical protein